MFPNFQVYEELRYITRMGKFKEPARTPFHAE